MTEIDYSAGDHEVLAQEVAALTAQLENANNRADAMTRQLAKLQRDMDRLGRVAEAYGKTAMAHMDLVELCEGLLDAHDHLDAPHRPVGLSLSYAIERIRLELHPTDPEEEPTYVQPPGHCVRGEQPTGGDT